MQYFWHSTASSCSKGRTCAGHTAVLHYKSLTNRRPLLDNGGNPPPLANLC